MSTAIAITQLVVLAAASGALSMWLYKLCSPQERLAEVVVRIKETQRRLMAYDGEFAGAQPLIVDNLKLSLQRLGMVLFPSAMAAAPILAVLTWGMAGYQGLTLSSINPQAWYATPEFLFLVVATLSALAVKFIFRIKC